MNTVSVSASVPYSVLIGSGLLDRVGVCAASVHAPCTAAVITDDRVAPLFLSRVAASLERAGFRAVSLIVPHGEGSKSLETLGVLLGGLAERHITRSDLIVALGGGVIGDLAGFAAAVYLRGLPYIQLPTTLLAAVDSSVGGKTAVDLPAGKNLAGCFWQPSLVLCDCCVLSGRHEGLGEVAKYAVLTGEPFFSALAGGSLPLEELVTFCISCKADFVAADELDRGRRTLLNLGHTVGHAVERLSGYTMPHGLCVSVGLAVIARAAGRSGLCPEAEAARILSLLRALDLPTETGFSAAEIADACLADKKIAGDTIRLVIPEAVGRCTLLPLPLSELPGFLAKGLCL